MIMSAFLAATLLAPTPPPDFQPPRSGNEDAPMNRRQLERHLRQHGCVLHHHSGRHDVWLNPSKFFSAESKAFVSPLSACSTLAIADCACA